MNIRITVAVAIYYLLLVYTPLAAFASELSLAGAKGDVLAVRRLLEEGADPNEPDEDGYTPLLRVAFAGVSRPLSVHLGVAELLIGAGADVNASVDVLISEDDNPVRTVCSLHKSVYGGAAFLELTLLLLEKGADPNMTGAWGRPLHIAAFSEQAAADHVKLLLDWGADAKGLNQWGVEPLAEAVTAPSPSFQKIELLLEAGADVGAVFDWEGHSGVNALMVAAVNGEREIIELLLDRGAPRYAQSGDGLTAYDYAVAAGRLDNASLLR